MAESDNSHIGVLSDTHDQVHYLERVISFFNRQQVHLVVHCGDWISPFTLQYYTRLKAPLYGVFGNNDGDKFLHTRVAQRVGLSLTLEDQLLTLEEAGRHIAIYHGTSQKIVEALVKCGDYDVVFYGHNHISRVELVGKVLVMNPGSLMDYTNQSVQGASVGLYNSTDHSGTIYQIDKLGN